MAGRQNTGGMTTGGQDYVRDQSIGQTLASRSQAMRDINISNAVLKQQQIAQAAPGLQTFLGGEREQQGSQFYGDYSKALYDRSNSLLQSGANINAQNTNTANNQNFLNSLFSGGQGGGGPVGDISGALLKKFLPSLFGG